MLTVTWEVILQLFAEILIEFGFGSIVESARARSPLRRGSASRW